jgi:hypothetical protein
MLSHNNRCFNVKKCVALAEVRETDYKEKGNLLFRDRLRRLEF